MGTSRVVHVPTDSELAHLLDEAGEGNLRLEKDGIVYRLVREEGDESRPYDPAAVRDALARLAGALSEDEADRLIENVYRAREEGSRPAQRP